MIMIIIIITIIIKTLFQVSNHLTSQSYMGVKRKQCSNVMKNVLTNLVVKCP